MKFVEDGSFLEAQINFLGRRIPVLVEKTDEPKSELTKKINSAKNFWAKNERRVRSFLKTELDSYQSKPDFVRSKIEMKCIVLQLTHDNIGSSKNITNIVFEFLIPYENSTSVQDDEFAMTSQVVYQLGFDVRGSQIVWGEPTLDFDFDANAFG